ncbi:hypothetical protein IPM19_03765 [bacterium]|nr:MAG: hypothetical protein IPM19_03765 [bacterium]
MSEENNRNGQSFGMNQSAGRSNLPWVILAVVILLIILGVALFRDRLFPSDAANNASTTAQESKPSGYQAVFLTNGQVYFGKLSDVSATYATLTDIYYLQVAPQPGLQGSGQNGQQQQQQQQQLLLVKLGKELHGPVDEMKINRDQILFYEDIKEDGTVMTKIREDKANTANGTNNQQQQQQQQNQNQQQTQTPATGTNR